MAYLQLDGVLNHILPLIQDTDHPTQPSKPAIKAFIQQYTLDDFEKRVNPPHTYPPRVLQDDYYPFMLELQQINTGAEY